MENNSQRNHVFDHAELVGIEWDLVRAIELFHESPRTREIKGYVQDYLVRYCYERKLPIKDTVEMFNEKTKKDIRIEMTDIIPESKRGQAHLINMTLIPMLNKDGKYLEEEKTEETVEGFCDLTGVSRELVDPIVNTFVKWKKRNIIEKELYDFLGKRIAQEPDETMRKGMEEEAITAYADVLKVTPQYVKGVLKNKKKKDEEERKRIAEYRASTKKGLSENPDGAEER